MHKGQFCFEGLWAVVPATELLEGTTTGHDLFLQLWWGQHSVLGLANMDVQHSLIKDVTKSNRARASFCDFLRKNRLAVTTDLLEA